MLSGNAGISSIEKINSEFYAISAVKTAMKKDEDMDFNSMSVSDTEFKIVAESIKIIKN